MKKVYVYVDETGQDTLGKIYIVVSVLVQNQKDELEKTLLDLEIKTGKRLKWRKSDYTLRLAFMRKVSLLQQLKHTIFWSSYEGNTRFKDLTALSVAKAIHAVVAEAYKAVVIVDGLTKTDSQRLGSTLRKLRIRTEKVLGLWEEQSVFIRLADSCAGLIRDASEKEQEAVDLVRVLKSKRILSKI